MSNLNQSPNQGRPPPKTLGFVDQVEALFRRNGYTDWAVVVRQPGQKPSRWLGAGNGVDALQDREAMAMLCFELGRLQAKAEELADTMEQEATRRQKGVSPAPIPSE